MKTVPTHTPIRTLRYSRETSAPPGCDDGEPLFEVVVCALHSSAGEPEALKLQEVFRRLLRKLDGIAYGEITVHFGAGKALRIVRVDSEVII